MDSDHCIVPEEIKQPPKIIRVVQTTQKGECFYRSIEQAFRKFYEIAKSYELEYVHVVVDDSPQNSHLKHPPIIIIGRYR